MTDKFTTQLVSALAAFAVAAFFVGASVVPAVV